MKTITQIFLLATLFVSTSTICAGNYVVANNQDSGPGSLRQAVLDANATGGGAITFSNVTGTITLTSGELLVSNNTTLIGPGSTNLAISGNHASRVFNVANNFVASFSGLTIRDGQTRSGTNGVTASVLNPGDATPGGIGESGGGIFNAGILTLKDCAVTNNATGSGGRGGGNDALDIPTGGGDGGSGGGIYNAGMLTLIASTLANNRTGDGGSGGNSTYGASSGNAGAGAGICSAGTLMMTNCTLISNTTGHGGDGPGCSDAGSGGSGGLGGGIFSVGTVTISSCTLGRNTAGRGGNGGGGDISGGSGGNGGSGGGIYAAGTVSVENCTVSENLTGAGGNGGSAFSDWGGNGGNGGVGGGVFNGNIITLVSCTIARNTAAGRGAFGIGPARVGTPGTDGIAGGVNNVAGPTSVQILNTLLALNIGVSPDVSGSFVSLGHNLVGVTNGSTGFAASGDLLGWTSMPLDPKLDLLTNNGGTTLTCALRAGSPAIDAGIGNGTPNTDQRGVTRPQGAGVDIGAFELEYTVILPTIVLTKSNAQMQLSWQGMPGDVFRVLASTNLLDWQTIGTVTNFTGSVQFIDTGVSNFNRRFYRAVMP